MLQINNYVMQVDEYVLLVKELVLSVDEHVWLIDFFLSPAASKRFPGTPLSYFDLRIAQRPIYIDLCENRGAAISDQVTVQGKTKKPQYNPNMEEEMDVEWDLISFPMRHDNCHFFIP